MYWNSVGEQKLLKFAPRHLTPNNLSSKFLLLELAVLLLALNHDCQSCASSPTGEPKSSTNVFVSSQHTPPAATQFLWPHAQLRRLAFMCVGCRRQSRKQDRARESDASDAVVGSRRTWEGGRGLTDDGVFFSPFFSSPLRSYLNSELFVSESITFYLVPSL